jgi:NADH dehydrogenase FAD-containing subunit
MGTEQVDIAIMGSGLGGVELWGTPRPLWL